MWRVLWALSSDLTKLARVLLCETVALETATVTAVEISVAVETLGVEVM